MLSGGCGGPIAQRLEQSAHNRKVPGSNPGGPTRILFCLKMHLEVERVSYGCTTALERFKDIKRNRFTS